MSRERSSSANQDLIATNTFHEWWIGELRNSLAPAAIDVDPPETEPERKPERRMPPWLVARGKLLFACATGLFWGAAVVVVIDGEPDSLASSANAAQAVEAPAPRGIVEVGEIRVLNSPGAPVELPAFDRSAASRAVKKAASEARACARGRRGSARVMLHFDPSGSVERAAVVGGPFVGTQVGTCIGERLRDVRVPPYSGQDALVYKTLRLP